MVDLLLKKSKINMGSVFERENFVCKLKNNFGEAGYHMVT
jgi:hypothetical protein